MSWNGIYRGKVLDNNDPLFLGRVKIEVYPMMIGADTAKTLDNIEGIETGTLPWAVPSMPLFEGAGSGYGFFAVPKTGTYVFVFFENGNLYQPVYFAAATDGTHGLPTERNTNYPDRKVWKSSSGCIVELDDTDGEEEMVITHPSGTIVSIEPDGKVTIDSVGEVAITAAGKVAIQGSTVEIN